MVRGKEKNMAWAVIVGWALQLIPNTPSPIKEREDLKMGPLLFGAGFALGLLKSLHTSLILSVFATKLSIFFSSSGHRMLPGPARRNCR